MTFLFVVVLFNPESFIQLSVEVWAGPDTGLQGQNKFIFFLRRGSFVLK